VRAHLGVVAVAFSVVMFSAPLPASAVLGDCSQPVTGGATPTATDCLYILRTAVALDVCSPTCICAPKGSLPVSATDALVCLTAVVGQPTPLDCPCGSSTTTSTDTTITTITTSTTTTTAGETTVACTIDTAACVTDACTCFDVLEGLDYHLGASGQVSGPVGTQLRTNSILTQGGAIDCGAWSQIDSSINPSCDLLGCCARQGGQPEQTTWTVTQALDFQCFCPDAGFPLEHEFDVQCQLNSEPVVEIFRTTDPCP
jgi:hypothetical protein